MLGLAQASPATVQVLYSTFGRAASLRNEVETVASRQRVEACMSQLRAAAGLPSDWVPPDEAARVRSQQTAAG